MSFDKIGLIDLVNLFWNIFFLIDGSRQKVPVYSMLEFLWVSQQSKEYNGVFRTSRLSARHQTLRVVLPGNALAGYPPDPFGLDSKRRMSAGKQVTLVVRMDTFLQRRLRQQSSYPSTHVPKSDSMKVAGRLIIYVGKQKVW